MRLSRPMESPYLTSAEVAAYLRVDPQTVRRWCASGQLPAIRAGRVFRMKLADVERFVQQDLTST